MTPTPMKPSILALTQLKKWEPCGDWTDQFKAKFGPSATWDAVIEGLIAKKSWSEINWLFGKRLTNLSKRQVCAFSFRCSHRALKYARKQDLEVLVKAISFAKRYAETGKVNKSAARSAARSAESAAWSAESAAWAAARSAESAARSAAWSAARSAARSAESAARSAAWSAARSAWSAARSAEYRWQNQQLNEIEAMPRNKVTP